MTHCKKKKCGCLDTGLTTPTPCAHDTIDCPVPDPCSETFSDCCVVHDGDGIAEFNIQTGDRLCDILQKIALAYSPGAPGVGIVNIVDNEDGTFTIFLSNGTDYTITLPGGGAVPNDDWIALDNTDMTLITPAATATLNTITINLLYKIVAIDTVIIKGFIRLDVTTNALTNNLNFNFRWPDFSGSNWFVGTKSIMGTLQRVPITIINSTGGAGLPPRQQGSALGSTVGGINLIQIGETYLDLPNDDYILDIHFEFTAPLQ